MYKNILVPVDGSETADAALQEAIRLARSESTGLRIVHVVDSATGIWDSEFAPIDLNQIREAARSFARSILENAQRKARDGGVDAEVLLLEIERPGQRVAKAIAEQASDWPADIIVIGTHGRRGLDHLLLGSVAEGVMRLSPVPVLLVRGHH
ncbi:MAG: universal stress protein [Gammaproteobacteria bacterium]|nr:universal stress protein [Gammaproteobacteria bacterium]